MTEAEALEMRAALAKHYKQPVRPVNEYCKAFTDWSTTLDRKETYDVGTIRMRIVKSCLLKRLIYIGEPMRTRRCPIHKGEWSGCYMDRCPAGCDTCGCACGWIPEDAPAWEAWGWAFWLTHALDDANKLPGIAPAKFMKQTKVLDDFTGGAA